MKNITNFMYTEGILLGILFFLGVGCGGFWSLTDEQLHSYK